MFGPHRFGHGGSHVVCIARVYLCSVPVRYEKIDIQPGSVERQQLHECLRIKWQGSRRLEWERTPAFHVTSHLRENPATRGQVRDGEGAPILGSLGHYRRQQT